jgi:hypothetical protein
MLPFTLAALFLIFSSVTAPSSVPANLSILPSANTVTKEDFYAHYLFKSTFSLRPLNETRVFNETVPLAVYELASDGLPYQNGFIADESPSGNIPLFPLADLLGYLDTTGKSNHNFTAHGLWLTLLPLLFVLFFLIQWLRKKVYCVSQF